ncbi:MAG: hypothetical protein AAFY59_06940 [Pseudomonadota bacterium]
MDELIGAFFAPFFAFIGAVLFFVLAVVFLPFVLLGQIVYLLMQPKSQRHGISWERKSVFRHYTDGIWEGVVVYGVATLGVLAVFGGTAVWIEMRDRAEPAVQVEETDGLLKRAISAGGKAAVAEAEERGWLDRFRGDDEAEPEKPVVIEQESAEKKPFWKVWD